MLYLKAKLVFVVCEELTAIRIRIQVVLVASAQLRS